MNYLSKNRTSIFLARCSCLYFVFLAQVGFAQDNAYSLQGIRVDAYGIENRSDPFSDEREINIAVPGEFLINVQSRSMNGDVDAYVSEKLGDGNFNIAHLPNSTVSVVSVPRKERGWVNLNDYLDMLEQAPGVEEAQPNYVRYSTAFRSPLDDPLSGKQWFLAAINAERAWHINQDASAVTVAVIDDAIMIQHEDIHANLWVNADEIPANGVDDDGNGYVDDVNGWNFGNKNNDPSPYGVECIKSGHGTHVAGAIGAVGGNRLGVSGVAPKVKIMALAIGRSANKCGLDSAGILEAVRYAVDNGAKVINLSLGGPVGTRLAERAYRYASDHNVLVVVAAGNDGLSNDVEDIPGNGQLTVAAIVRKNKIVLERYAPSYPAAFSRSVAGMLTVANLQPSSNNARALSLYRHDISWDYIAANAVLQNGQLKVNGWKKLAPGRLTLGSSYGARSVQIGTPGTDIYSTIPTPSGSQAVSGYGMMTGTSMASPITAGAAALVWASFPDLTNIQLKQRLLDSVVGNDQLNGKISTAGQLDVYAALCGRQFSTKAAGCDGASSPPPASKPPPAKPPKTKPPIVAPPAAPDAPKNKPVQRSTPNDWLRGEGDEDSAGGIQW
jgi:subtilisin family serine protease